jgi:hypothetical protein
MKNQKNFGAFFRSISCLGLVIFIQGCEPDTITEDFESFSRIESSEVLSVDLTQGSLSTLVVNDSEIAAFYESDESLLWGRKTDSDDEPVIELAPSRASEQFSFRNHLLSYGAITLEGLSEYQRIHIQANIDLTKVGAGFESEPLGCDVHIYNSSYYNDQVVDANYSSCIGDTDRSSDFLSAAISTMGESEVIVDWRLETAQFRRGVVGYQDISLPATDLLIQGVKYDRPFYAESFDFSRFRSDEAQCSLLSGMSGSISIDQDGESSSGSLVTLTDTFVVNTLSKSSQSLTLDVRLTGANQNLDAQIFYGEFGFIYLQVTQPECEANIKFNRVGGGQATYVATEVLYLNSQSELYDDPILEFVKLPYESPSFVAEQGLNLVSGKVQAGDRSMISTVSTPEIQRAGSDAITLEYTLDVDQAVEGSVAVSYAVNYGSGWIVLDGKEFLSDGINDINYTFFYAPESDIIQVALVTHSNKMQAVESDADIILKQLTASNISVTPSEGDIGIALDIDVWPINDLQTCDTNGVETVMVEVKDNRTMLVSPTSSDLVARWQVEQNGHFGGELTVNGDTHTVTGNISSMVARYQLGNCYGTASVYSNL